MPKLNLQTITNIKNSVGDITGFKSSAFAWPSGTPQTPAPNDVTFGFFTDVHANSNKASYSGRYPQDAFLKLADAVSYFNTQSLDFIMMGGDYIDHVGETAANALSDLALIDAEYANATAPRYYVLGNHDLDAISKAQFISNTAATAAYYSFDVGTTRVIVLDANFTADSDTADYDSGNFNYVDTYIPPSQRVWLDTQLSQAAGNVIVFCHQRLDDGGSTTHRVLNASVVRGILETYNNVTVVFQGHSHENAATNINGIRYYGMEAMTDGAHPDNAYSRVAVKTTGEVEIEGFGNQSSYDQFGGDPAMGTSTGNLKLGADQLTLQTDNLTIGTT